MASVFREQAVEIQKRLELLQEKQLLLERLAQIEEAENGTAPLPVAAEKSEKSEKPAAKRGRPPSEAKRTGVQVEGKTLDLPALLESIGESQAKPLSVPDYVTLVRTAGYTTNAKDLGNMVYQALLKLVKRGRFEKNHETREYLYIGNRAA